MTTFTPFSAFAGGILIGLGAAFLLYFNQKNAGISGIAAGLLNFQKNETPWRLSFLAGLLAAPILFRVFGGNSQIEVNPSATLIIVSGLMVGFGTRMAGGCTSGHGVCGIARLSIRSIVATLTFMLTGGITIYLVRHVW